MFRLNQLIALIALLLFFPFFLSAQTDDREELTDITNSWEISLTGGMNNFLGDIGGNTGIGKTFLKDYTFKTLKPFGSISGTYNVNQFAGIQLGFNYTAVTAADSLIVNTGDMERWRYYRNLSFRSNIFEGYIGGIVYPTMFFDRRKIELHRILPFLTAGIGVFHFNPQAELNGTWYNLQPLHLEGEGFKEYPDRKPYKLTQLYMPTSIGIKYHLNNMYSISGGMLFRKTFTDYIDDISTTYIDPQLFYENMPAGQAAVASQLYSRSLTPWKVHPDLIKAFSTNKDTYTTLFLTISIRFRYTYFYYPKL